MLNPEEPSILSGGAVHTGHARNGSSMRRQNYYGI